MTAVKVRERKARVKKLITALRRRYTSAGMILQYSNNWELLVAVILSAQCTDKRVNDVTKKLFKKYKTLDEYILANPKKFEQDIFSTGFYRHKTKNILAAAKFVKERYHGNIPKTMQEMLAIPGVARKTANVVLGNAHNIVEGIAVDTHVRKFAIRFDLSDHTQPEKIERDLMQIMPKKDWFAFTYLVIEYGREIKSPKQDDPLVSIFSKARERWKLVKKAGAT